MIEDHFQRPWLHQAGAALDKHRRKRDGQQLEMRPNEPYEIDAPCYHHVLGSAAPSLSPSVTVFTSNQLPFVPRSLRERGSSGATSTEQSADMSSAPARFGRNVRTGPGSPRLGTAMTSASSCSATRSRPG